MYPVKEFTKRFETILERLDALTEASGGAEEALDDLNAELEDAILLLSQVRQDEEDWREELAGALESIHALSGDYRALAGSAEGVGELAERLAMTADMALSSLNA